MTSRAHRDWETVAKAVGVPTEPLDGIGQRIIDAFRDERAKLRAICKDYRDAQDACRRVANVLADAQMALEQYGFTDTKPQEEESHG